MEYYNINFVIAIPPLPDAHVSSRVVILPITSNIDKIFPFEAKINVENKKAKVLADQIRTVDKIRLRDYISTIIKTEIKDIEKALKITLSLD